MDILKIQNHIIKDYIVASGQNILRNNLIRKSEDIMENYIMGGNVINYMIFGGNIVRRVGIK